MKRLLAIIVAAMAGLVILYAFQPSHTPPPQPPLITLNSANFNSSFYGALNSNSRAAHLILLLSPT